MTPLFKIQPCKGARASAVSKYLSLWCIKCTFGGLKPPRTVGLKLDAIGSGIYLGLLTQTKIVVQIMQKGEIMEVARRMDRAAVELGWALSLMAHRFFCLKLVLDQPVPTEARYHIAEGNVLTHRPLDQSQSAWIRKLFSSIVHGWYRRERVNRGLEARLALLFCWERRTRDLQELQLRN